MTFLMQKFQSFRQFEKEAEAGSGGEPEKKELTPSEKAAAERAKINVAEAVDLQPDEDEEDKDDDTGDGDGEKDDETEVEKTAEQIAASEKTEEELKAEKAAAKTQKEKERVQRKIDKEVAKRKAAEERVKELEAKLAADPDKDKLLTEEEVDKRAKDKARQIAAEEQFIKDCDNLLKEATKVDKDFKKKIDVLAEEVSPIPGVMIGILTDIDNSGDVLAYFVKDEDGAEEYEKIVNLANNPAKMGIALTKLSTKLAEEKKPKPKDISKVPEPPEVPGGHSRVVNMDLTKAKDQAEFNRIRAAQIEQRRKEKMAR